MSPALPLRVALLGAPHQDLTTWAHALAQAIDACGLVAQVQLHHAPANPNTPQVLVCLDSPLLNGNRQAGSAWAWQTWARAHQQRYELTLWRGLDNATAALQTETLRRLGIDYCRVADAATDDHTQALAALAPAVRKRGWLWRGERVLPASRWRGLCEGCADPDCERALFRGLR